MWIAISFTPFLGLHALLAITLAWDTKRLYGSCFDRNFVWKSLDISIYLVFYLRDWKVIYSKNGDLSAQYLLPSLKHEMIVLFILVKNIFLTTDFTLIKENFNTLNFHTYYGFRFIAFSFNFMVFFLLYI